MAITTKKGPIGFPTWIACGFGLGFAPLAPGSISTLFLVFMLGAAGPIEPVPHAIIIAAMFVVGIPVCNIAEQKLGHDAGSIVWDEFLGFAVATWGLLQTYPEQNSWTVIIAAWASFRIFDVIKLWPVNAAEKLPRGWGIIGDDLLAGVYANLAVRAVLEWVIR